MENHVRNQTGLYQPWQPHWGQWSVLLMNHTSVGINNNYISRQIHLFERGPNMLQEAWSWTRATGICGCGHAYLTLCQALVCYFFTVIKDEIVWYLINQRITLNILFMWHHRTTSRNEMEEATDIFTHIVAYIQVELIIIKNIYIYILKIE